jgi:hypothetical protein
MPERQDLPDLDDRAPSPTDFDGRDRPDEAEGYSFVLDDEE